MSLFSFIFVTNPRVKYEMLKLETLKLKLSLTTKASLTLNSSFQYLTGQEGMIFFKNI